MLQALQVLIDGKPVTFNAADPKGDILSTAQLRLHTPGTSYPIKWVTIATPPKNNPVSLGSATALGHGGMAALDNAHAALSLGARTIVVPRMSSGDPRPRHRDLSHHTTTVLRLMLRPATVALPPGIHANLPGEHEAREGAADLDGYLASGLPARTMGRGPDEDELFFRASLAGGSVLAESIG